MKSSGVTPALILRDPQLAIKAHGLGLETRYVKKRYKWDLLFLLRVWKILRNSKVELIQANGTLSAFCVSFCLLFLGEKPIQIVSVHSLPEIDYSLGPIKLWVNRRMNSFAWERASRIIVVSNVLKQKLIDLKVDANKIFVVHNGMDYEKFNSYYRSRRERLENAGKCIVIGTAGRLSREKGQDVFLRSIAEVMRRKKDVCIHAVIMGEGPEKTRLESLAGELGLENSVKFPGFQENIGAALSQLDIFVLPSRMESFPMILLEAGAVGLPVIATSVGGVPEMIENGKEGVLVPPEYAEQMADAITGLIDSPELCFKIGESFHTKVVKKFSLEAMKENTLSVYKEVFLSGKQSGQFSTVK